MNWKPKMIFNQGLEITREYFQNKLDLEKINN